MIGDFGAKPHPDTRRPPPGRTTREIGNWAGRLEKLPAWLAGSGAVQVSSRDLEDSVQMLLKLAPTPSPTRCGARGPVTPRVPVTP